MGYLLNGQWVDGNPPEESGKSGTFERIDSLVGTVTRWRSSLSHGID